MPGQAGKPFPMTTNNVAYALGVKVPQITMWRTQEVDPLPCKGVDESLRGNPMVFDPHQVFEWRLRRKMRQALAGNSSGDEGTDTSKVANFHVEKARLTKAQADQKELDYKIQLNQVLPVEDFEDAVRVMAAVFRSNMESLPAEVQRNLPHLSATDVDTLRRILAKSINALARNPTDPAIFESDTRSSG